MSTSSHSTPGGWFFWDSGPTKHVFQSQHMHWQYTWHASALGPCVGWFACLSGAACLSWWGNKSLDSKKKTHEEMCKQLRDSVTGTINELQTYIQLWNGVEQHAMGMKNKLKFDLAMTDVRAVLTWRDLKQANVHLILALQKFLVWLDQANWIPPNFSLRSELNAYNDHDLYNMILKSMGKKLPGEVEMDRVITGGYTRLRALQAQGLSGYQQGAARDTEVTGTNVGGPPASNGETVLITSESSGPATLPSSLAPTSEPQYTYIGSERDLDSTSAVSVN